MKYKDLFGCQEKRFLLNNSAPSRLLKGGVRNDGKIRKNN
jgi:hypothetical protein